MIYLLNNDTGRNIFCGPGAISIVTGQPVSKIEKMVRRYRKTNKEYADFMGYPKFKKLVNWMLPSNPIKAMWDHEIIKVLQRLKYKVKIVKTSLPSNTFKPRYISLRQFVMDTEYEKYPYIISVKHHYMVTYRGTVLDNNEPWPTPFGDRKPKRRVISAI